MTPTRRSSELELDVPGMTLAAREWGSLEGQPVLGLHGWLDNAATFEPIGPRLDDIHLVSLDFPGHGHSDARPKSGHYHFIDLVPVIFDAADTLGWETFSLLGHSMGAGAASLAAGTRPERIERTVLIDGLGPWSTAPGDAPDQLREGLDQREALGGKSPRAFDSPERAKHALAETYDLEPSEVAPIVERNLVDDGSEWRLRYDIMLKGASLLRLTEPQVLAFLGEIDSPTRLIRPSEGWPVDEKSFQTRLDAVDELEVVRIEGPHHVHLRSPERVGGLVQEGLER